MTKEREDLIKRALLQMIKEREIKIKEYDVHFVVPFNKDGGEIRGVIEGIPAVCSADVVRYVSEAYDFPEVKDDEDDKLDFLPSTGYGIIKIVKHNREKRFTEEEMLKSWEFIFNRYYREVTIESDKLKTDDNRREILSGLIELYELPRNNYLASKYYVF